MAMVEKFEDLKAWQKARSLAGQVYKQTATTPFDRDWSFRDQMRRAAVSVVANVAEGFGRSSRKDFSHFLVMARASCTELASHCYIAEDIEYMDAMTSQLLRQDAAEVARIIGGLRESLVSRKPQKGR